MHFLDEEEVHEGEIVPMTPQQVGLSRVKAIEDRLFDKASEVLDGVLAFADVKADDVSPPGEWIEEYGLERAEKRFRMAKYGLMSAKEAPVAIKVAQAHHASITNSRAKERNAPISLNAALILIPAADAKMEELVVQRIE